MSYEQPRPRKRGNLKACSKVPVVLNPGVRFSPDYESSNLPALALASALGPPPAGAPYIRYHPLDGAGTSAWPPAQQHGGPSTRATKEQPVTGQRPIDAATDYDLDEDDEDWLKKFETKAAKRSKPGQPRISLDEDTFESLIHKLEMLHFGNLRGRAESWMKDIKVYKVPHIPAVEVVLSRSAAVKALSGEAETWTLEQVYDYWKGRFKANRGPLLPHLWFEQPWKARNFRDPDDPDKIGDMPFNEPEESRYKPRKRATHHEALEQLVGSREELENVRLMTDQVKKREKLKRSQVKLWSDKVQMAIKARDPELLPETDEPAAPPDTTTTTTLPNGRLPNGRFARHVNTPKTEEEEDLAGQRRSSRGHGGRLRGVWDDAGLDDGEEEEREGLQGPGVPSTVRIKPVPAPRIPQTQQRGGVRVAPAALPSRCSAGQGTKVGGAGVGRQLRGGAGGSGRLKAGKQAAAQQTRASLIIKAATERRGRKRAAPVAPEPVQDETDVAVDEQLDVADQRPAKRLNARRTAAEPAPLVTTTPALGSHLLGAQKRHQRQQQQQQTKQPGSTAQGRAGGSNKQHTVTVRFSLPDSDFVYPSVGDDEDEEYDDYEDADDADDADYVPSPLKTSTVKGSSARKASPALKRTPASATRSSARHQQLQPPPSTQTRTPGAQQHHSRHSARGRQAPLTEPPPARQRHALAAAPGAVSAGKAAAPKARNPSQSLAVSSKKRPRGSSNGSLVEEQEEEVVGDVWEEEVVEEEDERPTKRATRSRSEPPTTTAPTPGSTAAKSGTKAAPATAGKAVKGHGGPQGSRQQLGPGSSGGMGSKAGGSKVVQGTKSHPTAATAPPSHATSHSKAPGRARLPVKGGSGVVQGTRPTISAADLSRALRVAPHGAQAVKAPGSSSTRQSLTSKSHQHSSKQAGAHQPSSSKHAGAHHVKPVNGKVASHPALAHVRQGGTPSPARLSSRLVASPLAAELMIAQAVLQNPKRSRELASLQMSSNSEVPQELRKFLGTTLGDRTNL